jgi:hypothetical protein
VQWFPEQPLLARWDRNRRRKTTPGILLCTLPKSGSTYIHHALTVGLGKEILRCGGGGFFPCQAIPNESLNELNRSRSVYLVHCEASRYNKIELSNRLERMIVHVRDPRQAILSWTHFIAHVVRSVDPVQGLHYGLPWNFLTWNFHSQLDWQIDNFLPKFVDWVRQWHETSRNPTFKTRILFTTNELLAQDPKEFFTKILDFYGIDRDLFDEPQPPVSGALHVRSAKPDEWRSVFTQEQLLRATSMLPNELCAFFGWHRLTGGQAPLVQTPRAISAPRHSRAV